MEEETHQLPISLLSKQTGINRGSLYQMMKGKRAIPLDIAEKINLEFKESSWILTTSNVSIKIPEKLTNELAYLVGMLRDGTVVREKYDEYLCAYYSKNKEFIEILQKKAENIFGVKVRIERFTDVWGIRIRALTLYLFFRLLFDVPEYQHKWKTPKIIEKADSEIQRWYISGFWDAEGGCPHVDSNIKMTRSHLYVSFYQKNKESLEFIKKILEKNNIETRKIYWNKRVWVLKIKSSSIPRFAKYIQSQFPKKRARLEKISEIFSTNSKQPRVTEFTY
jgi:intein-encoded DNA endonuclease-like protein